MKRVHGDGDPDPQSILVILPTWVGDSVMATPTLRAIRERFAGARIVFLIEPNLRDLIRGGDWMNGCVEWPVKERWTLLASDYRSFTWDLRRQRFDWAILLSNSFRAALIARIAGAGRRIGYDRDGRGFLLTDRIPPANRCGRAERPGGLQTRGLPPDGRSEPADARADEWTARSRGPGRRGCPSLATTPPVRTGERLPVRPGRYRPIPLVEYFADLAEAVGCARPGDAFELFTTADCDDSVERRLTALGLADHHPLVVISPGAKFGASKCWMPERFAAVADRLYEQESAAVVVTCGPGEEPIARRIGSSMRRRGWVFDDPCLTLGELKSLLRRCDLLLCNDAGPRHIAKAFNRRVVTVFGPTHPDWTATNYPRETTVRIDVDCGPCQQPICPLGHLQCLTGVDVETVAAAVRELLATLDPAPHGGPQPISPPAA